MHNLHKASRPTHVIIKGYSRFILDPNCSFSLLLCWINDITQEAIIFLFFFHLHYQSLKCYRCNCVFLDCKLVISSICPTLETFEYCISRVDRVSSILFLIQRFLQLFCSISHSVWFLISHGGNKATQHIGDINRLCSSWSIVTLLPKTQAHLNTFFMPWLIKVFKIPQLYHLNTSVEECYI